MSGWLKEAQERMKSDSDKRLAEHDRIWNEAIEAAAKICYDGGVGYPVTAEQIRKLKK